MNEFQIVLITNTIRIRWNKKIFQFFKLQKWQYKIKNCVPGNFAGCFSVCQFINKLNSKAWTFCSKKTQFTLKFAIWPIFKSNLKNKFLINFACTEFFLWFLHLYGIDDCCRQENTEYVIYCNRIKIVWMISIGMALNCDVRRRDELLIDHWKSFKSWFLLFLGRILIAQSDGSYAKDNIGRARNNFIGNKLIYSSWDKQSKVDKCYGCSEMKYLDSKGCQSEQLKARLNGPNRNFFRENYWNKKQWVKEFFLVLIGEINSVTTIRSMRRIV